jgi:hypothetical protein
MKIRPNFSLVGPGKPDWNWQLIAGSIYVWNPDPETELEPFLKNKISLGLYIDIITLE